ncbi:MAG TPA: hypothetical protein VF792_06805 [Ktedonobacterales bacterium]
MRAAESAWALEHGQRTVVDEICDEEAADQHSAGSLPPHGSPNRAEQARIAPMAARLL